MGPGAPRSGHPRLHERAVVYSVEGLGFRIEALGVEGLGFRSLGVEGFRNLGFSV